MLLIDIQLLRLRLEASEHVALPYVHSVRFDVQATARVLDARDDFLGSSTFFFIC